MGEKSESADLFLSLIPGFALFNFRCERQQHGTTTNTHSFWSEYEETKSAVLVSPAHFPQGRYRWEKSHLPRFSSHSLAYEEAWGSVGYLLFKTFSEKMPHSKMLIHYIEGHISYHMWRTYTGSRELSGIQPMNARLKREPHTNPPLPLGNTYELMCNLRLAFFFLCHRGAQSHHARKLCSVFGLLYV